MPEIKTEDKLQYTILPIKRHFVDMKIKAAHDAHICLSGIASDIETELIEIFIGAWENKRSAIRYYRKNPISAQAETPEILSAEEGRWFRIVWNTEGYIAAYLKDSEEPFVEWHNPNDYFSIDFFGIKTCWGSQGDWVVDGQEIQTPDSHTYNFVPNQGHALINFEVKAKNDAHVMLTGEAAEVKPCYEIFLGGWGNSKSAIRFNQEKPDVAEAETPELLSGDEFKKFWVKIQDGEVQVGRGGETDPFLSYKNPEPFPITHFGIRTSWGAEGEWRILGDDAPEGTTEEAETTPAAAEESNEIAPEEPAAGDAAPIPAAPPSEEGVQWVKGSAGSIPDGALKGGEDNGNALYVARAEHEEAVIPGKLLVEHGVVYIPWGGGEHSKEEYEVLVIAEDAVSWVDGTGDTIPENAIRGGTSLEGEPLYIGRAAHEGAQTIGKVHPSHACLYISYGGAEINYPEYQILVKN